MFVLFPHFLVHITTAFIPFCIFDIDQISSIYYTQYNVISISSVCWEGTLAFEIIQGDLFCLTSAFHHITESSEILPFPFHYLYLKDFVPLHHSTDNGMLIWVGWQWVMTNQILLQWQERDLWSWSCWDTPAVPWLDRQTCLRKSSSGTSNACLLPWTKMPENTKGSQRFHQAGFKEQQWTV